MPHHESLSEEAVQLKAGLIGKILKENTSLTDDALSECLRVQSQLDVPQRIGQILLEKGFVSESDIAQALSQQVGYLYLDQIPPRALESRNDNKLPISFLKKHRLLPFEHEQWGLSLAMVDPLDITAIDSVVNSLDTPCKKWICTTRIIEEGLSHYHFQDGESASNDLNDQARDSFSFSDQAVEAEDLLNSSGDVPVIRLVHKMFFRAIQARASDIHIEPYEQEVKVRYRIDGVLHTQLTLPKEVYPSLVSRLKIMAKLNIAERRLPQDGRSRVKVGEREIDIRVSTVPTSGGERVVLRLLDEADADFFLEQLGFEPDTETQFRKLIHRPHGIVLITGPTGSGKTTTLYGALTELNSDHRNIMTVEDPIEYRLAGISQTQIKPKIGLTFASCLRHILRQDPDVIMIGEIRDLETARIAIQSALTGHLVLSTLHTNDAASAITRLIDMGVEPYLTCSSVLAIMAQRLVRRVCPHCRGVVGEEQKNASNELPSDAGEPEVCMHCTGTGFRGRFGIFELLMMDDEIREKILNDSRSHVLKQAAVDKGMRTLRADGIVKVDRGETTLEEILRVTQDDEEL